MFFLSLITLVRLGMEIHKLYHFIEEKETTTEPKRREGGRFTTMNFGNTYNPTYYI